MTPITVDPEKCNRDGICVKACPTGVIVLTSKNELPVPVKEFEEYCLACGHCVAVCPTGAFSLDWLQTGQCPSIIKERALSYLELYAPLLDLGTCWGGYFFSAVNAYPPLFEALGIPADHKAFGAVMVGYPKLKYQRLPLRKEPKITWMSSVPVS